MANKKAMTTNVTFLPTKKLMFEDAVEKGHTFFVQKDYDSKSGKKQFASFIDLNDFLTFENTIAVEDKHHYEFLKGEVAEYYDIDYKVNPENRTIEDVVTDFIDARTDFQEIYFPDIPLEREHFLVIITDDKTGGNRLSSHIIIRNGKKFADSNEVKKFIKHFEKYVESSSYKGKVILDTQPYGANASLKILGHSKFIEPDRISYRYPDFSEFNDTCDTKLFYVTYLEGTESFYPKIPTKSEEKKKKKEMELNVEEEEDDDSVNLEDLKNWVDILSDTRMDNRDTWLLLCWCLRNITNKSKEGLELYKYKSSMSPLGKHDEEGCETEWEKYNGCDDTLGMGSLILWAKEDNYEAYKNLIKTCKSTQKYMSICLNGSHTDIAKLFIHVYAEDNIKISSSEKLSYYGWNETTKLWEKCTNFNLSKKISDVLVPLITEKGKQIRDELGKNDKNKEALLTARLKQVQKLIANLKTIPYLKNICSAIAGYPFDKEFESKVINKSVYELPIKGCKIINLKTLEVRDRVRTDYFSFELNVVYRGRDCNFEHVLKFFNDITCKNKELVDYHRRMWGYMMTGDISDRSLHIMWGNGCNGKSSIVNIFKAIMGNFSISLDEDTIAKQSNSGAKPEMMDLIHSRCGFLPESDKKEKINAKRMKTITGDDEISARHLFQDIVKFKTQCKPVWSTNFKPEIDIDDKAILDRLKLIPFLGEFEKTKANTDYIIDLQVNKLNEFFTWFCIGAFDWINGAELKPCSEMNIAMDDYIKENNPLIDFVNDMFDVITKDDYNKLHKDDKQQWRLPKAKMFQHYGGWRELNGEKYLGKVEFNRMIEKRIEDVRDKEGRYFLCKLKLTEENFPSSSGAPPM
jgi:P4 family phage/plasmid primase-like protien